MTDDHILMPRRLTAEMVEVLRNGAFTGPQNTSPEALEEWYNRLAWMVCVLDAMAKHADKQRAAQATGDGA